MQGDFDQFSEADGVSGGRGRRKEVDTRPIREAQDRFFVHESRIDQTTGEYLFEASRLNDTHRVTIRIPRDHPDARSMFDRIMSSELDIAECRVTHREGDDHFYLVGIETMPQERDRIVKDDKGPAWTWSDALDEKVDKFFRYGMLNKAMKWQQGMLDFPVENMEELVSGNRMPGLADDGNSHPGARALFLENLRSTRPDISEAEAMAFFNRQAQPDIPGNKAGYVQILKGEELDDAGNIRRIFYDAARTPGEQMPGIDRLTKEQALSRLLNYSYQDAATQMLASSLRSPIEKGGIVYGNLIEQMQKDLVTSGCLEGGHPNRDANHLHNLAVEFAEMTSGQNLRTLMAASGAVSATEQFDDVRPNDRSPRDAKGNRWTYAHGLFTHVAAKGGPTPARNAHLTDPELAVVLRQTTNDATELHESYDVAIKGHIDAEMTRSMAHGRNRTNSFDQKAHDERMKLIHGATTGIISNLSKHADDLGGMDII